MQFVSYLNFNGQCEAAFNFYHKVLGGQIVAMFKHADTPQAGEIAEEFQNAIMHARLVVGDAVLMGSDAFGHYDTPKGFSVSIMVSEAEEAERIFAGLSENGTIHMPIQETFWAIRFAMFVDQFGIPWMINCENPQV